MSEQTTDIAFLPLEEQAEYVSDTFKGLFNADPDYGMAVLRNESAGLAIAGRNGYFNVWSVESIGAAAYTALHSNSVPAKTIAINLLSDYADWSRTRDDIPGTGGKICEHCRIPGVETSYVTFVGPFYQKWICEACILNAPPSARGGVIDAEFTEDPDPFYSTPEPPELDPSLAFLAPLLAALPNVQGMIDRFSDGLTNAISFAVGGYSALPFEVTYLEAKTLSTLQLKIGEVVRGKKGVRVEPVQYIAGRYIAEIRIIQVSEKIAASPPISQMPRGGGAPMGIMIPLPSDGLCPCGEPVPDDPDKIMPWVIEHFTKHGPGTPENEAALQRENEPFDWPKVIEAQHERGCQHELGRYDVVCDLCKDMLGDFGEEFPEPPVTIPKSRNPKLATRDSPEGE